MSKSYYNSGAFEAEKIISFVTEGLNGEQAWCVGNMCKYLLRLGAKNPDPMPDLVKLRDYAHMLCTGEWFK